MQKRKDAKVLSPAFKRRMPAKRGILRLSTFKLFTLKKHFASLVFCRLKAGLRTVAAILRL